MTASDDQGLFSPPPRFAFGVNAHAVDITGAGATFPFPIYAKWAEAYKQKTGVGMNYQSIGSGGGIAQIKAKTVDFGASDMPLKADDLEKSGLMQFPAIIGGVVPIVNIEGIAPGALKLTGPVLADIYLGKIKNWNDKAIVDLNPGPQAAGGADHRRAPLGRFGHDVPVDRLPVEGEPRLEDEGRRDARPSRGRKAWAARATRASPPTCSGSRVRSATSSTRTRRRTRWRTRSVQNKDGQFVQPDDATFQAAAAGADWKGTPGFGAILTDQPGKTSWPITGASFILHADQAGQAAERRRGDEVLRLGVQERAGDGRRTRLRAAARAAGQARSPTPGRRR